jgi:hypothetical protein
MTDRELLALCTMLHSNHDKAVELAPAYLQSREQEDMEYHYRQHTLYRLQCRNGLSDTADFAQFA